MEARHIIYILIAIVAIVAVVSYVLVTRPKSSSLTAYDNVAVSQQTLTALRSLAANNTLADKVGPGVAYNYPNVVNHPPLTVDGKPAVFYVGADYCPYCAVTRWSLIIALMRFGNFTSLQYMTSSATDVAPNTATFSFYNSSYESNYLALLTVEVENVTGAPLQTPTSLEGNVFKVFAPTGGIPFMDFGNRSVINGAEGNPLVLKGMDWNQTLASIGNPNSTVSQEIMGSANLMTAEICIMDNSTPASVCSQPYVKSALKAINS